MASKTVRPHKIARYGWIPDLPDHRDVLFGKKYPTAAPLPPSTDLRNLCSPIENQGQLGSCTANALAGALEFLEDKDKVEFQDVSRLFIYYNERVIENTVKTDSGAQIRDGIKSLASVGVCAESLWPYVISRFAAKPNPKCYATAGKQKITSYQRLETLNDMQTCLASGYPFVFGFTVYESFESATVAKSGVVPMPKSSEQTIGGHAVCAVGYDNASNRFIARNSWGTSWGQKGYFTIPYDYLTNRNLSDDLWTIRSDEGF